MAKKQKTPAQIAAEYEQRAKQQQSQISQLVDKALSDVVNAIAPYAAAQSLPPGTFSLSGLPALERRIDQLISTLTQNITSTIQNGIKDIWQLSNTKNDLIADIRLDRSLIPEGAKVAFYDTNAPALQQFLIRKENGLNLSDRVYNSTAQFKAELEAGIGVGISKGVSAAEMGRDLRQYLNDPDKLFRRVRDEEGNLQLSKAAKAFHPGQGVYRSSRKNIERLTRTETNIAYHKADNERWKKMPFVVGIEVRLSASHQKCDMCDSLQGEYPPDFNFVSWHPQCLCFSVPVLMNDQQFMAYQKLVLNGTDTQANINKIIKPITEIPETASTWLENNKQAISRLKSTPYFFAENSKYMPELPDK